MIRRPKRSTIRTDVYEIRPRADKHGVDLVGDALPYSPMWYRGPKAITDAVDHAKFFSRSHDVVIHVHDAAGNVTRRAMRARVDWGRDPLLCGKSLHLSAHSLPEDSWLA
jgi:hypothetical protein